MVKVFVTVMANVTLLQDHAYAILDLKELNVKVSLIENIFCSGLSFILRSILGMSCPSNGEIVCNGNGQCDHTTGSCNCNSGFEGTHCEG
jgi:hypothetical protein